MKNWIWKWFLNVMIVISVFTVTQKKDIKCRIYEDEYETWVPDFINNMNRKHRYNIVLNFNQEHE
jgi:hypothetical protein